MTHRQRAGLICRLKEEGNLNELAEIALTINEGMQAATTRADENAHLWSEAQAEMRRLREALLKYGRHQGPCASTWKIASCTCGFAAALTDEKSAGEES